jgi:NTP pyrophosphatase (non-canonical NTP hydrolase)
MENAKTIKEFQKIVKNFAERNSWKDFPNIDKIDHLHEELVEISQHIRYKSKEEVEEFVNKNKKLFEEEIGDLFFGVVRLANQFGVDLGKAFEMTRKKVFEKYNNQEKENNVTWK